VAKSKSEVVAFNAGELGKEALARVDLENYARGAEIMENIFPLRQGGMTKMPGTIHVGSTPSDGVALLRPFIFSENQRFAMELSENKVRLIFEGAYVAVAGAVATVGTFTDESAATSTGGGAAPSGGTAGPPGSGGSGVDPGYDGSYAGTINGGGGFEEYNDP
jgi:hypothetical protein